MRKVNLSTKQKQTHRHRKQTCGYQGGVGDLKNNGEMNSFTKQKQTHRCIKQTYSYQGASMGERNWEIGIDIYTLLEIK